jgi:hypothetical protein
MPPTRSGEKDGMQTSEPLTLEVWRGYQRDSFPRESWVYEEEMLRAIVGAPHIDLLTRRQYRNFDLELEWRVTSGGNSGILYRVTETMPHAQTAGPLRLLLGLSMV